MYEGLLLTIALLIAAVGAILVLAPDAVTHIERVMNRTWGDQHIFAVRIGFPGEHRTEQLLNKSIVTHKVEWDGWIRKKPRVSGVLLWLAAGILLVIAP